MRILLLLITLIFLNSCIKRDKSKYNQLGGDTLLRVLTPDTNTKPTTIIPKKKPTIDLTKDSRKAITTKYSVVILPIYDTIANNPNRSLIIASLKQCFSQDSTFNIDDSYKTKVKDHYRIYHKRFCKEIINSVHPDLIVMTKMIKTSIDSISENNKWEIEIKCLETKKDSEFVVFKSKEISDFTIIEKDILSTINSKEIEAILQQP